MILTNKEEAKKIGLIRDDDTVNKDFLRQEKYRNKEGEEVTLEICRSFIHPFSRYGSKDSDVYRANGCDELVTTLKVLIESSNYNDINGMSIFLRDESVGCPFLYHSYYTSQFDLKDNYITTKELKKWLSEPEEVPIACEGDIYFTSDWMTKSSKNEYVNRHNLKTRILFSVYCLDRHFRGPASCNDDIWKAIKRSIDESKTRYYNNVKFDNSKDVSVEVLFLKSRYVPLDIRNHNEGSYGRKGTFAIVETKEPVVTVIDVAKFTSDIYQFKNKKEKSVVVLGWEYQLNKFLDLDYCDKNFTDTSVLEAKMWLMYEDLMIKINNLYWRTEPENMNSSIEEYKFNRPRYVYEEPEYGLFDAFGPSRFSGERDKGPYQ